MTYQELLIEKKLLLGELETIRQSVNEKKNFDELTDWRFKYEQIQATLQCLNLEMQILQEIASEKE